MNKLILVLISAFAMIMTSCVERQPATPANNAARTAAPAANVNKARPAGGAIAGGAPSGAFTYYKNPMQGLMKNVGLTSQQAAQFLQIRQKWVTQMASFKKLPNGRFNLEQVKPVMEKMNADLKGFLGDAKFKRYTQYNAWNQKQNVQ